MTAAVAHSNPLMQKALSRKANVRDAFKGTRNEAELVLAWINGEVTTSQVAAALDLQGRTSTTSANALKYIASIVKRCVNNGHLNVSLSDERRLA